MGYFLIQHKAQLGAKFVYKITVFRGEDEDANMNLIFYVDSGEVPLPENVKGLIERRGRDSQRQGHPGDHLSLWNLGGADEVRVLERSVDGRHILRECRLRDNDWS